MGRVLDNIPWWSQLTDPDPTTALPDVFARHDCGEECAAMLVHYYKGRDLAAATIRHAIPGHESSGNTTGPELVQFLSTQGIRTMSFTVPTSRLKEQVKYFIDHGDPCLLLGYWLGREELHWITAVGYGNDALLAMDPWNGGLVAYRWKLVESIATGDLVGRAGR